MLFEKYKNIINPMMSKDRFMHSINVSNMAQKLAEINGQDKSKAMIAGILHDIMKEVPDSDKIAMLSEYNLNLTPLEKASPNLWHSILGAEYIKTKLGIYDKEIIDAVRYHTTGRAEMTTLDKLIFVADFISEDRTYRDVDVIRSRAFKDLDAAVFECLRFSVSSLSQKGCAIHPDTVHAYNGILIK